MKPVTLVYMAVILLMSNLPASAGESLAKHIARFNGVTVFLGPQTDDCGIRDLDRHAKTVNDGLIEAGLQRSPAALSSAYLFIWGMPFGPFNQQCAIYMSLSLGADLTGPLVAAEALAPDDEALAEYIKEGKGAVQSTFWISSSLSVHIGGGAADAADKTIGVLIGELTKTRAK